MYKIVYYDEKSVLIILNFYHTVLSSLWLRLTQKYLMFQLLKSLVIDNEYIIGLKYNILIWFKGTANWYLYTKSSFSFNFSRALSAEP